MRWVFLSMALVFLGSLTWVVREGLIPRPIKLINPSQFTIPEEVGVVVFRRIRQELRSARELNLISSPRVQEAGRIWNGFIAAAREDGVQVVSILREPSAPIVKKFSGVQELSWSQGMTDIVQQGSTKASETRSGDWRVSVMSLASALKLKPGFNLANENIEPLASGSVTVVLLPIEFRNERDRGVYCHSYSGVLTRLADYECAIDLVSREVKRKRLDLNEIWSIAQKHGRGLYVVYVSSKRESAKLEAQSP